MTDNQPERSEMAEGRRPMPDVAAFGAEVLTATGGDVPYVRLSYPCGCRIDPPPPGEKQWFSTRCAPHVAEVAAEQPAPPPDKSLHPAVDLDLGWPKGLKITPWGVMMGFRPRVTTDARGIETGHFVCGCVVDTAGNYRVCCSEHTHKAMTRVSWPDTIRMMVAVLILLYLGGTHLAPETSLLLCVACWCVSSLSSWRR